jgi:hypothetical protein
LDKLQAQFFQIVHYSIVVQFISDHLFVSAGTNAKNLGLGRIWPIVMYFGQSLPFASSLINLAARKEAASVHDRLGAARNGTMSRC